MHKRIVVILLAGMLILLTIGSVALSAPPQPSALQRLMHDTNGQIEITKDATGEFPSFVQGKIPVESLVGRERPISDVAMAFFSEYGAAFGVNDPLQELVVTRVETDTLGMAHLTLQQVYERVPVYHGMIKMHFSADNRTLEAVSSSFVSGIRLPDVKPLISGSDAQATVLNALPNGRAMNAPELVIFPGRGVHRTGGEARLAWMIEIIDDTSPARNLFVIDAYDGLVLDVLDLLTHDLDRKIYDAENKKTLPGTLVRSESDPPTQDIDVDQCYDFSGKTYQYYANTHGRDSFDDAGATLTCTTHYGSGYRNAFWDGSQTVFGDEMVAEDVVAHEWTHAITEHTAALEYRWQAGALNESFSDIFGAMVDREDWLMGEDLPDDVLGGRPAIRDLSDPARLGQPAHTDDWVSTCSDNEGVHSNSGITNKAYYNIATAIGKEKAEQIFYRALVIYLDSTASLEDARAAALKSAEDLYGANSAEYTAVGNGFNAVGLDGQWQPEPNDCVCAATALVRNDASFGLASGLATLNTLYRVRDEVMNQTEAGRYYQELYYKHSGRIAWLMLQDADLRAQGIRVLRQVTPGLDRFVSGQGSRMIIPPSVIADLTHFLRRLAAADRVQGDGELAKVIHREMNALDLQSLAGMTYEQAWDFINSGDQTMLPRIHLDR